MLVHKSIDVRPEVWRRLRINAELSGVPVRDYLSFLVERSKPVEDRGGDRACLQEVAAKNQRATAEEAGVRSAEN